MNFQLVCIYIKRRGADLLPVPRCVGLRIALLVETSNAESPTPMYFIPSGVGCETPQSHNGEQYISRGVPVALFLTRSLRLRSSHIVKTKAFRYAFYVYVFTQPFAQGASGMGFNSAKVLKKLQISQLLVSDRCNFR